MDIREVRRARLQQLVDEQKEPGKQRRLATLIGKAPAQVSQWINRTRTITEDTARAIEAKLRRPHGWMDLDPAAPVTTAQHTALVVTAREPAPGPPPPPHDFHDRRLVSDSDWALLQDIKTAATPDELAAIRERAAMIERMVSERLAVLGTACDTPPEDAPAPSTPTSRRRKL